MYGKNVDAVRAIENKVKPLSLVLEIYNNPHKDKAINK